MDRYGYRENFYQQINKVGNIDCPGLFRHNNDDLANVYNDNKNEFLKNYKFNLCPENTNYPGYCTEKVFEAIQAGCIRIYWGSDNNPEPDILNHKAIIFLKPFEDNVQSIHLINDIKENKSVYLDFINQPHLLPSAPEIIFQYFENLESKIKQIVS